MTVNTPYDDVFRTLLNDCSSLIIPVVNEIFHESYSGQEAVVFYPNEHFINAQDGQEQERVTDSCFTIRKEGQKPRRYHIECQSTADNTMLIRMFEYDSQIALDAGEIENNVLTVRFPHSAVLYLRHRASTPDVMTIRIELPGKKSADYNIPVLKAQRYTADDIFAKGLLFLIPFRIFAHEGRFAEYERDDAALRGLMSEYEEIKNRLAALSEAGRLTEYVRHTREEMSGKVLEHIAEGSDRVREGVKSIMGGRVLEYEAKTILNEGIALGRNEGLNEGFVLGRNAGRNEGRDEGLNEGRNEGIASTARRMLTLGFTLEQVALATGLSMDEIVALRDRLN